MLVRLLHSKKTEELIVVIPSGMVMLGRLEHPQNALSPISVTTPANRITPLPFKYVLDTTSTLNASVLGVTTLPSTDVYQISLYAGLVGSRKIASNAAIG